MGDAVDSSGLVMDTNTTDEGLDDEYYRQKFTTEYSQKVLPVSILFGLTACFGCVANLLVIYIYGAKYKRCNFKYFLFVMGLIGLVQCIIMLPIQVGEMHYWFNFPTSWLCRVSAYVFGYTVIDCYFVLLLIALDRFRKVCRPYDWQIQPRTARKLCYIVSLASLIFALPPGVISGNHRFVTSYNDVNVTVIVCATDDIYMDRDWAVKFLLLFGGIPVSIVIVITCGLYAVILKQFCKGSAYASNSLCNASPIVTSKAVNKTPNSPSLSTADKKDNDDSNSTKSEASPKNSPKINDKKKSSQIKSAFTSFLAAGGSIRNNNRGSKQPVREKLVRKTFIVLIITVTCIIALVITFCLHGIAEEVNSRALTMSTATLNAFVIFHRGSFSIICAIFPIIYGIRDHKFREALRHMMPASHQNQTIVVTALHSSREVSRC